MRRREGIREKDKGHKTEEKASENLKRGDPGGARTNLRVFQGAQK